MNDTVNMIHIKIFTANPLFGKLLNVCCLETLLKERDFPWLLHNASLYVISQLPAEQGFLYSCTLFQFV